MSTTFKNNTPKVNEGKDSKRLRVVMLLVVLFYTLLTYPSNLHAEKRTQDS